MQAAHIASLSPDRRLPSRRGAAAAALAALGAVLAFSIAGDLPADRARPGVSSSLLSCHAFAPGQLLRAELVTMPPDAFVPRHIHGAPVFAFVTRGSVRSRLDGGVTGTFVSGQAWFETRGTVHDFVENASATDSAAFLAVFIGGCEPLTTYL